MRNRAISAVLIVEITKVTGNRRMFYSLLPRKNKHPCLPQVSQIHTKHKTIPPLLLTQLPRLCRSIHWERRHSSYLMSILKCQRLWMCFSFPVPSPRRSYYSFGTKLCQFWEEAGTAERKLLKCSM